MAVDGGEPPVSVEGEWPLRRLLTEDVGSGPKSADDVTRSQAREAVARIVDGDPDPTTLGAFLLANRWKRNTPEELAGFLDELRRRSVQTAEPVVDPVDCGANYDGKERTALLGVASGVVAAAAGTPVVVHSGDRVPASQSVAYRHVLDELGVPTDLPPKTSARMVDETGFGFYYQPRFAPKLHALLDRREALGVRSFLNTIETLSNPANAAVHLGSFFHRSFARKMVDTIRQSQTLDHDRVLMIQGMGGYDDLRPGRPKITEFRDGVTEEYEIETHEFGLDAGSADLEVSDVRVDSARITEEVLADERDDEFVDAVALNAAGRIYVGGDAEDLGTGLERARSAIDSGEAAAVLAALRAFEPLAAN